VVSSKSLPITWNPSRFHMIVNINFSSESPVVALMRYHLEWVFTFGVVNKSKKIRTRHWSRNDTNHLSVLRSRPLSDPSQKCAAVPSIHELTGVRLNVNESIETPHPRANVWGQWHMTCDISRVSAIERAEVKQSSFNRALILILWSSTGDHPGRCVSWRSSRHFLISSIQNYTVWSE
jgi:hypothetical protein